MKIIWDWKLAGQFYALVKGHEVSGLTWALHQTFFLQKTKQ